MKNRYPEISYSEISYWLHVHGLKWLFSVCVFFFLCVFFFPLEAWQCFIFHPKCPFHLEAPVQLAWEEAPAAGGAVPAQGTWVEGLFLLPPPTLCTFFPWGSWGKPRAGFLFSVPLSTWGWQLLKAVSHPLINRGGKKGISPGFSLLPIFWHLICLRGGSKRSAKPWYCALLLWLERWQFFFLPWRCWDYGEALEVINFPHLNIWFAEGGVDDIFRRTAVGVSGSPSKSLVFFVPL